MINTREIAKEYRLTHWSKLMQERIQSGQSIRSYCRQNGICTNTYFYWQRRLRTTACEQLSNNRVINARANLPSVSFAEIKVAETVEQSVTQSAGTLKIALGNVQITVESTYPPVKLAELLLALTKSC